VAIIKQANSAVQAGEQALEHARECHRDGRLEEAAGLYQAILQVEPGHAEANHGLGVLAVAVEQFEAALPYFAAALDAEPQRASFWLSYIDALSKAGQPDAARDVLVLAKRQGLAGEEVDALALRLAVGPPIVGQPVIAHRPEAGGSPKIAAVKASKHAVKSARNASHQARQPSQHEIDLLVKLYGEGRQAEAMACAREMTSRFPAHWIGWKMLGVLLQQSGRDAEALVPMQTVVKLSPRDAEAHNNLGIILKSLGRLEESAASYRRALKINSSYAQAHGNLGATLHELGRLDEAEASYRQALKIDPNYAKVHRNLGAVLHDLKRLDEAESCCRRALQLNPNVAEAHCNLGNTLRDMGRLGDSEASLRRALEISPDSVDAMIMLALTLKALDRLAEAESWVRRALEIAPDSIDAHRHLGDVLYVIGRMDESQASYLRALELKPDDFNANCNLGVVYWDSDRLLDAEASLRRALEANPKSAPALNILGVILMDAGRLVEAEASLRRALAIEPEAADMHDNLGTILNNLGRMEEAVACYRRALAIKSEYPHAHSNMLHCLTLIAEIDAHTLFAEHRQFGIRYETPLRSRWPDFSGTRDPGRTLRVGFVSGDLRNHAIAYYIEPILAKLAGHAQVSLHAYSNSAVEDEVSRRLRQYFVQWRQVIKLSDDSLARQIMADGIDILIDLSGHTAKNRLLAFARKPAPVQVSWMGFPGTTGLESIDYYLADRFFLPQGRFDDQFTEKIVRLPASAPFLPSSDAPPTNELPGLTSGYLTFGSFNRLNKLNPRLIALWSGLLRSMPESRVLLGGVDDGEKSNALAAWFAREGIERGRVEFHGRCDMASYLKLHHKVDICLDTYPYGGGTTTLHALWMGVPTLSLAGGMPAGQSGASILGHAGLEEFVARNPDEFVGKGISWQGRLAELADIRAGLRERLATSAIGQPALIAAGLERALRIMWQRWCAGQPPESFEVDRHALAEPNQETGP
jgi:predicted O-linked N-acetylglucosamine transferase (SPINDLY family)